MRITEILIHNYRPYSSFQIDFTDGKDTDLHAVIASNGVGKTSLLNAIEWCLYEEEPHLGDDKSLPICNLDALQTAKANGKRVETTSVAIKAEDNGRTFKFERIVNVHTDTYFAERPKFKVFVTPKGESTETYEDDAANDIVNIYLPKKIRGHFFFDGEQLSGYFGKKDSNINVKSSIHEVAQISVVTTTKDHLAKTIKDLREEIAKINPATQGIVDEITAKEKQVADLKSENFTLEGQVTNAKSEIKSLDGKISGSENAVAERNKYEANSARLGEIEQIEAEADDELAMLIKKYYTPLMMFDINKATFEYIDTKKQQGKLPPDIDIALIRQSLAEHKCAVCGADFAEHSEEHLNEILRRLSLSTSASNKLMEIKNDVNRLTTNAKSYSDEKNAIFAKLKRLNKERKDLEDENKDLQTRLLDEQSTTQIAQWMLDKERYEKLLQTNNQKIGANNVRISDMENEIQGLQGKLDKARKENEKCSDLNKQLNFATDALNIVSDIESEIIEDVKSRMETETMELFNQFLWKENTYGRIQLGENYQLELFSKKEDISCLGSCSAAETQLLAMAFTLALHRVSGHNAPLFIDTPVGRVSDKNRENFAKALVEVSRNKQIIMSFTPSEYSAEVSRYFDSALASKRILNLRDEKSVQ